MHRACGIALIAGLGAGCQAGPAEPGPCGALSEPLAGGLAGGAWPAVGLLRVGRTLCTATLIAPQVVVTARHCIDGGTVPADVELFTGESGEDREAVGWGLYWTDDDLLAVVLDRAPSVAPAPYLTEPLVVAGALGAAVTLVGYGKTGPEASDHGVKRSGTATIEVVGDVSFVVGARDGGEAAPCFGDSGGPALLDGMVAGILSGGDPACAGRGDVYLRVDRHLDLVEAALAAAEEVGSTDCR